MAKIIHCYPAKNASLPICCNTCGFCHTEQASDVSVCNWDEEEGVNVEEPKKWRCEHWELDRNVMLSLKS